jgi:hypothetical protein
MVDKTKFTTHNLEELPPALEGRNVEIYLQGRRWAKCVGYADKRTLQVELPKYAQDTRVRRIDVGSVYGLYWYGKYYTLPQWKVQQELKEVTKEKST